MASNRPLSEEEREGLRRHIAGATVSHESPFAHLPVPVDELSHSLSREESREIAHKWIIPFSMRHLGNHSSDSSPRFRNINAQSSDFIEACIEVTPELTLALLAVFNWQSRAVAARFVAVKQFFELQEPVSNLLLRSDVCYAGANYCLALASLGNERAAQTLETYLDYYLTQPDLYFDQSSAMAALLYMDEVLGTSRAQRVLPLWERFVMGKSGWDLEPASKHFRESMSIIRDIQRVIARGESGAG